MELIIRKYVFLKSCPNYIINTKMIFFRSVRFLKYILLSRHRRGHGIHSPFIFDLVSRVFRNRTDRDIIFKVEKIRKKMIADRRTILVHDLGLRSELSVEYPRRVSDIAKKSPVTGKYGKFLSRMAAEFGYPLIIELGTSLGISTMYMAGSCKETQLVSIEGCPNTAAIARQNLLEAGIDNVKIIVGPFDEILPGILKSGVKPGLVFIDGNHRKEPVIKYFNQIAEISDSKTAVIIDDISYSRDMAEAWNEIKLHKKVSVSIDINRMGILFFREVIYHNNYIIRY
jgi:predicted O-methyltransferase YrrM